MITHRCYRAVGAAALVLAAAVACGGSRSDEQATKESADAHPTAQRLRNALLTDGDLSGYRRRGINSGTLKSLGYQEVFDRLRKLDADKPRCLNGYLGGISGPAYDTLQEAPAAMAIFAGPRGRSFGQIIVSVPAQRAVRALDQPFPPECSNVSAKLPAGEMMTMTVQEIDIAPIGDRARAFRGKVVVAGKQSVILSETIRSDGFVHNIQLRGGDRQALQALARQALRKAQQNLA